VAVLGGRRSTKPLGKVTKGSPPAIGRSFPAGKKVPDGREKNPKAIDKNPDKKVRIMEETRTRGGVHGIEKRKSVAIVESKSGD